jgi:flagellar biosynthetic protein FlhB
MVSQIALYVGVAYIGIAGADYAWQRHRHEKSMKMTKDEVKQEAKQQDIAPEVRRAIRRRQFQQARKRMIAEVATADVVITNPTHFAVALRYDGSRPAPELIAKGADLVAAAIREEAEKHDVTVVANPPLARALYREVEMGQMIPDAFFQAVAEVLAFVYRTAGRKAADRRRRIREQREQAERARVSVAA